MLFLFKAYYQIERIDGVNKYYISWDTKINSCGSAYKIMEECTALFVKNSLGLIPIEIYTEKGEKEYESK